MRCRYRNCGECPGSAVKEDQALAVNGVVGRQSAWRPCVECRSQTAGNDYGGERWREGPEMRHFCLLLTLMN